MQSIQSCLGQILGNELSPPAHAQQINASYTDLQGVIVRAGGGKRRLTLNLTQDRLLNERGRAILGFRCVVDRQHFHAGPEPLRAESVITADGGAYRCTLGRIAVVR